MHTGSGVGAPPQGAGSHAAITWEEPARGIQVRRRWVLRMLAACLVCVPTAVRAALTPARRWQRLSASDRRLAALGARLAAEDPRLAHRLVGEVERRLGSDGAVVPRRALLDRARIDDELARGQVVSVDGWLLARSEAAACAYLHALAGDGRVP